MGEDRDLLDEQIAYYRARAAEYDATSTEDGNRFVAHDDAIRAALRAFAPRGRILELGAGTGQWTGLLADVADELVVTDASPEMLALNRAKVGERGAEYRVMDAFALEATHGFDVVFFGFLLSHVPPDRFEAFWDGVAGVLVPGGRVFFVDEGRHFELREDWVDEAAGVVRRRLRDGSLHRAVKVLWRPEDLAGSLDTLGWEASVKAAGPFYRGIARRR